MADLDILQRPVPGFARALPRWMVLLLVAVLARALTFGNPVLHVDEQFYFVVARAMAHGAIPYLDVWDRKPVGLFLLYFPMATLGVPLGIWAYQAFALACAVATAALIARLADRAGSANGSLPAGLAYLLWLNLLEGAGGQTPVFYNLLMVGAANLVAPRAEDAVNSARRLRHGVAAFALVGLALQIKYSVVFEGAFFGAWWLWREFRLCRPAGQAIALAGLLAAVAALPSLVAWGYFAAVGQSDAFVFANFRSIGARVPDPWAAQALNVLLIVAIVSPLASVAVLATGLRVPVAKRHALVRQWLVAWVAAAALGLLVFGTYFDHYALPLLVPLCACASGFFAEHRRRIFTIALLVLLLIGGQAILLLKLHQRGSSAQFAAITRAIGRGAGCLYVYSGPSMAYAATDRCAVTRYLSPDHLGRVRERGAIGVDQQSEIDRIVAQAPEIIVVGQPYRGERPELRASLLQQMTSAYWLRARLPLGNDQVAIYARSSATPPPRRTSTKSW